jgi:hypothetical protein
MAKRRKTSTRSLPPQGRIRVASTILPPGIVVDRYELSDLRDYDESINSGEKKHLVHVWTTLRDNVIDRWLDAERTLRTACVVLLSPTDELRPRVWTLMGRQSGDALIDLLADLLMAQGHELPEGFRTSLKALVRTRNLLAHQPSRPRESRLSESDGLVFLRSTGFKEGIYVEISYQAIEQAISDVRPVMEWLVAEIPDSDGVSVPLEAEVFDLLEARANPAE